MTWECTSRTVAMTGSEVSKIRRRPGLIPIQLAEQIDGTSPSVARWEQGVLGIRQSVARQLRLLAMTERPAKSRRRTR